MARATSKVQQVVLGREAVIEALLKDPWGTFALLNTHPLLAPFTARQRKAILRKVERRQWAEREAERLPELLARLKQFPPSQWGVIFVERPDLERKLSREQRARWRDWLRGRGLLSEGDNVIQFEPKESKHA